MSVVRCPWTRSTGCLRMLQFGAKVTAGPRRMNASLVWICNILARIQKTMRARPTRSTGNGLFVRLEFVTTFESALRMFAILDLLWVAHIDRVVSDDLLVAQD